MSNKIILKGRIEFAPPNKTKKHNLQGSWKRVAMIFFEGDTAEYYAWFIKKRYNLPLNKPLRGAHISFINDRNSDMALNGQRSLEEVDKLWEEVKKKWDGKEIAVTLSLDPKSDDRSWWLNVPKEDRDNLQAIRNELGLGKPYYGFHMSLGYANEKFINHSIYIHRLLKNKMIP